MTRAEKANVIAELKDKISNSSSFYLADSSTLPVADINQLRRVCFEKGLEFRVAKNTLIKTAFEQIEGKEYSELYGVLKGHTSIIFTETGNLPAKILKEYRAKNKKKDQVERPILKAAYIEESVYIGDDQLELLTKVKSKQDLLGEIILLLQSPAKNVVSALQSGGHKLSGILKTLSEREEN